MAMLRAAAAAGGSAGFARQQRVLTMKVYYVPRLAEGFSGREPPARRLLPPYYLPYLVVEQDPDVQEKTFDSLLLEEIRKKKRPGPSEGRLTEEEGDTTASRRSLAIVPAHIT